MYGLLEMGLDGIEEIKRLKGLLNVLYAARLF